MEERLRIASVSDEELQQRRSTRSASTARLIGQCSAFLRDSIPSTNIILEADFAKYIPLFNEKAIEEMGEDVAKKLADEYRGRFSLHHPIKIINTEITEDPNVEAAIYPEDGRRHVIVMMLPPVFKRVKTLNEIYTTDEKGNKIHQSKMPFLIDGLFNTSLRTDPISKGKHAEYVFNVARALHIANPETDREQIIKDFNAMQTRVNAQTAAKLEEMGVALPESAKPKESIKTPDEDKPMSGVIDW